TPAACRNLRRVSSSILFDAPSWETRDSSRLVTRDVLLVSWTRTHCACAGRHIETTADWHTLHAVRSAWDRLVTLRGPLLEHLGGLEQHLLRDGKPERLRRLEIDGEIEAHRPLHGQVARARALQNLVYIGSRALPHL